MIMPHYNPKIHHRKSIRLKGYDYSQSGLYFITICVQNRECLFGKIVNGEMVLNDAGKMADNVWMKMPERFLNVQLHEYVIMPNHFHAIFEIVGAPLVGAQYNRVTENNRVADNNTVSLYDPDTQNNTGAQNDPVVQNDMDTQNITDALNDPDTKNNMVTQNNTGAQNDPVVQNNTVTQNNVVAQNNTITQNDNSVSIGKGQPQGIAPTVKPKTVGDMLGAFQSMVTVEYIRGVKQCGWQSFNGKLWQRNYYENIIRNQKSYQRVSDYITNNPKNWEKDKFNKQ